MKEADQHHITPAGETEQEWTIEPTGKIERTINIAGNDRSYDTAIYMFSDGSEVIYITLIMRAIFVKQYLKVAIHHNS